MSNLSSLSCHCAPATTQEFYEEVDSLLAAPLEVPQSIRDDAGSDEEMQLHAAVFDRMQSFVALLEGCYDRFLEHQYNTDYCIAHLLDASFCQHHRDQVATCIVDLLGRSTSLPALLVTYDLLLAFGQSDSHIYLSLHNGMHGMARDKIARMVHQIWAGHYAAVAEARISGQSRQVVSEPPGWTGASFQSEDENGPDADRQGARETAQGHPAAQRLVTAAAEGSNAARTRLHQIRLRDKAIRLLYEVCRVQRLDTMDMRAVDEQFVSHLFDLVEETRHYEDEAFNYLLIKLIVALNEQFMVSSISQLKAKSSQNADADAGGDSNVVVAILKSKLHVTKTFGENLIFMLNRASSSSAEDFCMQLLVLKLLYLLFTTRQTAHYFYTNDLKVLVDVFIRELTDLPEESESLRHTYLRVLHPLLTNTQLSSYPYKRPQIRRLLRSMIKDSLYRGEVSPTTRRLVQRCLQAEWCVELDRLDPEGAVISPVKADGDKPASMAATVPEGQTREPHLAPRNPPSVLAAPRFRVASARSAPTSAPNTPPPSSAAPTASGPLPVASAGEDEAAMALADGKTTHDQAKEPSWQHQFARAEQIPVDDGSTPVPQRKDSVLSQEAVSIAGTQQSDSLLAPQRPVPRRASHNDLRKPSSSRRPPPAPPATASASLSAFRAVHAANGKPSRYASNGNGSAGGADDQRSQSMCGLHSERGPGTSIPPVTSHSELLASPRQGLPSVHLQADIDADAAYDWDPSPARGSATRMQTRSVSSATPRRGSASAAPSTPPTPSSSSHDEQLEHMTQSLDALTHSGDTYRAPAAQARASTTPVPSRPVSSASSVSSSPSSTTTAPKQRRRPPAPPSLLPSAPATTTARLDSPRLGLGTGSAAGSTDQLDVHARTVQRPASALEGYAYHGAESGHAHAHAPQHSSTDSPHISLDSTSNSHARTYANVRSAPAYHDAHPHAHEHEHYVDGSGYEGTPPPSRISVSSPHPHAHTPGRRRPPPPPPTTAV